MRVDGHGAAQTTSSGLLAVEVGADSRVVEWRFEPRSLKLSASISHAALVACGLLLVTGKPARSGWRAPDMMARWRPSSFAR